MASQNASSENTYQVTTSNVMYFTKNQCTTVEVTIEAHLFASLDFKTIEKIEILFTDIIQLQLQLVQLL